MKIKSGVDIQDLDPLVWEAANKIDAFVRSRYGHEITLTSGRDSTQHKLGSKHYEGRAVDIRTKDFPSGIDKRKLIAQLYASVLSVKRFDLLLEFEGQDREHYHLELDMKA